MAMWPWLVTQGTTCAGHASCPEPFQKPLGLLHAAAKLMSPGWEAESSARCPPTSTAQAMPFKVLSLPSQFPEGQPPHILGTQGLPASCQQLPWVAFHQK